MRRRIILDTETTGLSHAGGDRICEISCLAVDSHWNITEEFHTYLNPDREVPWYVVRVHGLTTKFLSDYPYFEDIAPQFERFVSGAQLIAHNLPFDRGFLNAELTRIGHPRLSELGCTELCTLQLARRLFPGERNGLDALCDRFRIDTSSRVKHGARLDTLLLRQVCMRLIG